MQPGHPNWMLDTDRDSRLPHRPTVDRAMERWFFSPRRHVPRRLLEAIRRDCSGLLLSNVQPASAVPFLTAARRLRLPVVAHVASWDHTVGKGVISPHCDLYVVQNRVMEDDLRRYHGIAPERVRVTGWPQTDLFHRIRPRAEYDALLRRYGLDPGARSSSSPGTRRATRPTRGGSSSVSSSGGSHPRERLQLLFRPHPRDGRWQERFAAAAGHEGVVVQEASYADIEDLATLLQHVDVVVCNAGTILLDALVGDRPAVCVLYDEGAPPGRVVGGEERRRRALPGARSLRRLLSGRALRRGRLGDRARARAAGRARRATAPSGGAGRGRRGRPRGRARGRRGGEHVRG